MAAAPIGRAKPRHAVMTARLSPNRALPVLLAAAAATLLYFGRGQVIVGDDLFYAQRLAVNPLWHAILHSNVYLLALPMVLYKAMFAGVGLSPYWPYRSLAVALSLLCAFLFHRLERGRIGATAALAPVALLLFFGSGGEVILTGTRLPSLLAIAAGLAAWLALERRDRGGDIAASASLLLIAATSHPSGLGFLAGAAVIVWLRGARERWRSAWILAPAVFAVVAYRILYQIGGSPRASGMDLLTSHAPRLQRSRPR